MKAAAAHGSSATASVSVFVRVRPLIPEEAGSDTLSGLSLDSSDVECNSAVAYKIGKTSVGGFTHVLGQQTNNQQVFECSFQKSMQTVLSGGTASLFCYGYTGSGKTHTVLGYGEEQGLFYLAAQHVLNAKQNSASSTESSKDEVLFLQATACEIYNDKVFDLLGGEKLECTLRVDETGELQVRGPAKTMKVDELEEHAKLLVGQLSDEQRNEMLQHAKDRFDETGLPSVADGTIHSASVTTSEGLRSLSIFCQEDLEGIGRSCVQKRAVGSSTQHEQSSRSHAILRVEVVTAALLDARRKLDDSKALLPAYKSALDNVSNIACKLLFTEPQATLCTVEFNVSAEDQVWDPNADGWPVVEVVASGDAYLFRLEGVDCEPKSMPDWAVHFGVGKLHYHRRLHKKRFNVPGLWESKHAALLAQKRDIEESIAGVQAKIVEAEKALAEVMSQGPESLGGSLVLVDLAGADYDQRVGSQQKESAAINKSLLALKECLRALAANSSMKPKFRDSKLTRIMEDSLAPRVTSARRCRDSVSVMLVNVSPAAQMEKMTLNALRYGQLMSR